MLHRLDEGGVKQEKMSKKQEGGRIIEEMIQRETCGGGGRRLWSGGMNQGCEIRASDQMNGQKRSSHTLQCL